MALLSITTPRGSLVQVESGNGTVTAELHWDASFGRRRTQDFNRVQSFIDSEVIRLMSPYTPIQTSMLIKSATLGTVIGSGKIKQIAPYAAWQYYRTNITRLLGPVGLIIAGLTLLGVAGAALIISLETSF